MDFYLARQPIFNIHKKLYAYELLYRGYTDYTLTDVSGNKATTSLLSSVFLTEGIGIISGSRPCFINFTEELIVKKIAYSFPKTQVVIEVLENVRPSKEVLRELHALKAAGYTIALDDFLYTGKMAPLVETADIIKIDVRLTPLHTIEKTLHALSRFPIKLLAEKVETIEEFERASTLGFHYYQGYFFSKPEKILVKELASTKMTLFSLLAEVGKKTTTLERLHHIVSQDLATSYKLLRFLNSAYFYRLEKVKSVKHAIAFLGEKELRRFILLVIVSELATEKPTELVRQSLVRAKFCELLASRSLLAEYGLEIFMVGMFSFMDAMLDIDMKKVMEKLPVTDEVKNALVNRSGMFAPFINAVEAYERRQGGRFLEYIEELNINTDSVAKFYLEAVKYSNGMV
ncbi:MAG: EAL domain-containing protein [Desulfopila sp.]|jgi:EAL and modified HD-GYP domain-containing signal transduction protein|nr:EAL domain-containing protein [Desulfopila sp.]